jgi:hypothetical protein
VEWRVGLDEPAVLLALEALDHFGARDEQPV